MKETALQLFFLVGVVCFGCVIIYLLRKNALSLKYSMLWLFTVFMMLILSVFPGILRYFATALGFELPSNALFSLLLGFVVLILLSLTSIVSKQTEKIKTLIQVNALLEKRIREKENQKGE